MTATSEISPLDLIYPADQGLRDDLQWPTVEILTLNLEALKSTNNQLACLLNSCDLPADYQLARASDGSPCYRIINKEGTGYWLGKRSAPRLAAKTDLERLEANQCSMAVNGFGDGYTIKALLARLSAFQAIFVLEKELVNILANLQLHDLSLYIKSGQLVIIHADKPFEQLTCFLSENPGYQLIEKALFCHHLSEQENNQFNLNTSAAVEASLKSTTQIHQDLTEKLSKYVGKDPAKTDIQSLTIANIPCGNNPADQIATRDLIAGFNACQVNCYHNSFDKPSNATLISQGKALLEQKPDAILLVSSLRKMCKHTLNKNIPIISILPGLTEKLAAELSPDAIGERDITICPQKCTKYFPEQITASRLIPYQYLVNTELYRPLSATEYDTSGKHYNISNTSPVIMLSERYPLDPLAYNVMLHSYQNMLEQGCQAIADDPAGYNSSLENFYFDRARKKSQAKISDDAIKESLQGIFSQMAESVCQDCYGRAILKYAPDSLSVFQWLNCPPEHYKNYNLAEDKPENWLSSPLHNSLTGEVSDGQTLNTLLNSARIAVFTSARGKVTQLMLNASAAGCLVFTKAHPQDNQADGLSYAFTPGKEIITFTSPQDLCRKIEYYLTNPAKATEITAAARSKLINKFSHKCLAEKILTTLKNQA